MSLIYKYILVYNSYPSQDFEVDIVMPLCWMHPSRLSNKSPRREILLHVQRMKSFLSGLMQLVPA